MYAAIVNLTRMLYIIWCPSMDVPLLLLDVWEGIHWVPRHEPKLDDLGLCTKELTIAILFFRIGTSYPHVVDVDWRLDYYIKVLFCTSKLFSYTSNFSRNPLDAIRW